MRYYFAGRFSHNAELRGFRDELEATIANAAVISRWIDLHYDVVGGEQRSFTPAELAADPEGCWLFGQHDLEDLAGADAIIIFTSMDSGGKGGRHIEHGIAIAYADNHPWAGGAEQPFRLVVIGPRENVFHCHPATEVYDTWREFMDHEQQVYGK